MSSRVSPQPAGITTPLSAQERGHEPVVRRYQPDAAVLEDLVEALYRLIMEPPVTESAAPESTCVPSAQE